ncbi:hypothetical protein KM043_013194 [Ampulex compressa]|nr:hypothetical protein KM043_013194 [Ampulex compressa]
MAKVTDSMPIHGAIARLLVDLLFLLALPTCPCLDLGQCSLPLGMESGEILDEDISASSMYDPSLGPKHAR